MFGGFNLIIWQALPVFAEENKNKTNVASLLLCDQRYVEVCAVEEERPLHWSGIPVGLVQQFKQSRPDVHWNPHNDALRHTWNRNA